jgi:hypothetical protein
MFILLSTNWRNDMIAPGPLATSHAQLFSRNGGESKCSACHAAADGAVIDWAAGFIGLGKVDPTQSQLCLTCHGEFVSPELALVAHNAPADLLRELSRTRMDVRGGFVHAAQAAFSPGDQLACSTCHREHHGPHSDLTAMDNAACQVCHVERYESFAVDHPDFGNWPYERRTRIAFNHASHQAKHFAEKSKAFDCRKCHVPDISGSVQLTASYEVACAECHDEKIATSLARGVPMFALPSLDVESLQSAGQDIGSWPESASGDFDGRLPPAMKLLLASDPRARAAIATLGHDFDVFDVDPAEPAQLAACADLANAIRELFADVNAGGPAAMKNRLSAVLEYEVDDSIVASLLSGISHDLVRTAAMNWLQLNDSEQHSTEWPALRGMRLSRTNSEDYAFGPTGTWHRDDATLSLRYRPAVHADPVLTGWLELLARTPIESRSQPADAVFNELASPTAPGLCISCHSTEKLPDGRTRINWRASNRANEPRGFTQFVHGPHLVLPQLADCTACHAVDKTAQAKTTYVGDDPCRFASDFLPLRKNQCAQCHTAVAAGDRCQSCHNYHVELPIQTVDMPAPSVVQPQAP